MTHDAHRPSGDTAPMSPLPGWGAALGFLNFPESRHRSRGDALAIAAITELVHRYAWSFDERRADLLQDCFTPSATWSGSIGGTENIVPLRGRTAIVEWLSGFWRRQSDQRRHNMMSVSVTIEEDDRAIALSSLLLTSASEGIMEIVLTSFYRFELERVGEVWRISSLFEGCDVTF